MVRRPTGVKSADWWCATAGRQTLGVMPALKPARRILVLVDVQHSLSIE